MTASTRERANVTWSANPELPLPWPPVLLSPQELGTGIARSLVRGIWPEQLYVATDVVAWAWELSEFDGAVSPAEALALVVSQLVNLGIHSEQSVERLGVEMARFVRRLDALEVPMLRSVDQAVIEGFVNEAVASGSNRFRTFSDPAIDTQHLRRSATRLFFRLARSLGLCSHDPTLDLNLPPRSSRPSTYRPLTDEEVVEGEIWSRHTFHETRLPAAWALGEATATASEIAAAMTSDVDLGGERVWLRGSGIRTERFGHLTAFGVEALTARLDDLEATPRNPKPLVYRAQNNAKSGSVASSGAVREVLVHAGLTDPDVAPMSLPAWAGTRVLAETGRIEAVATALGVRRLDTAARIVRFHWQET